MTGATPDEDEKKMDEVGGSTKELTKSGKKKKGKRALCCLCFGPDCFFNRVWNTYDRAFLVMLILQYINTSTRLSSRLVVNYIFQVYHKLEPDYVQALGTYIALPWTLKLLYGMICDSVPLCGSRKKSYIIVLSLVQFFCAVAIAWYAKKDYKMVVLFNIIMTFSQGFMDVVIDGTMVSQSKLKPKGGSTELQIVSWGSVIFGGIIFIIMFGNLLDKERPGWCFLIIAILALIIFIQSFWLSMDLEDDNKDFMALPFNERISSMCKQLKVGFGIRALQKTLFVVILINLLTPKFESYWYIYIINELKITQAQISYLALVAMFAGALFFIIYSAKCKKLELSHALAISLVFNFAGAFCQFLLAKGWVKPKNIFLYLCLTDETTTAL